MPRIARRLVTDATESRSIRKRWLHFRGLASLSVALSFLVMTVSGVLLYVAPRGRDANWSGWTCLGLWREQWVSMHIVASTLFILFGLFHLYFNWPALWGYLHSRLHRGLNLWKELLVAVVVVGGLSAAAVVELSPARQLVQGSEGIKDYWGRTLPKAPFPHAELLTLNAIEQRTGVSSNRLAETLRSKGYTATDTGVSLLHLAETNNTTPAAVFEVLRRHFPELDDLDVRGGDRGIGHRRGRGLRTEGASLRE